MKRFFLHIWSWMPEFLQRLVSLLIRPRYQVASAAIIFDSSFRILLCRHTYRRKTPWGLPGGDIKYREIPLDAVKREVLEETGLQVDRAELLWAASSREHPQVVLIYHCKTGEGKFTPNAEVSEVRFFPLDALPDLLPAERNIIRGARIFLSSRP